MGRCLTDEAAARNEKILVFFLLTFSFKKITMKYQFVMLSHGTIFLFLLRKQSQKRRKT